MWRDAFGPGYAVGPGGRLLDMLGKNSGKDYRSAR